jgi:uncharacterized membrane protein
MAELLAPTRPATRTRLLSIDALRGLAMVVMALDHTRDFLHLNGFFTDPTNLATTTPALFFTRWITHYCAPTFAFLAGASAFLAGRGKTTAQLSRFLLSRGLWLMLLEITVVNFTFWFDLTFSLIFLQIIWAIGLSLVMLSGLVWLPYRVVLGIGLVMLLGHNLLDGVTVEKGTAAFAALTFLHQPGPLPLGAHRTVMVLYPVLAWVGIVSLGYCFGRLFGPGVDSATRRRSLFWLGGAAVVGFVLLRFANGYGDPSRWATQQTGLFTLLSFLNTTKYPPSLLFTLMTLGPGMLFLGWVEPKRTAWLRVLAVYGRVPLFYYVLHFALIHALLVLNLLREGVPWAQVNFQNGTGGVMPNHGLSLGGMYVVWALVVLLFYPLCRWYGRFKAGRKSGVWSYL